MKGIAISPHILTLKPEPFTPLKRLGIPQTPVKDEENLVGFSSVFIVVFRKFFIFPRNVSPSPCHSERKFFWHKKIEVEESRTVSNWKLSV